MKAVVLSDIHANLSALTAAMSHCSCKYGDKLPIIHLGDIIDYCMRPNETIVAFRPLLGRCICNIRGNHEMAYFGFEDDRFSSPRGRAANEYTRKQLSGQSKEFIERMACGVCELNLEGCRVLCVHGDLHDVYWGKMTDAEMLSSDYQKYDFVLSGHSHVSHLKYVFDKGTCRKTVFVNPGSVGQPRNCNVNAQYAVVDFETGGVCFECVPYDISFEQSLFTDAVHPYYCERLSKGI